VQPVKIHIYLGVCGLGVSVTRSTSEHTASTCSVCLMTCVEDLRRRT